MYLMNIYLIFIYQINKKENDTDQLNLQNPNKSPVYLYILTLQHQTMVLFSIFNRQTGIMYTLSLQTLILTSSL